MFKSMHKVCRINIPHPHCASSVSTNDCASMVNEENRNHATNANSIEHPALDSISLEIIYVKTMRQVWHCKEAVIGWNAGASSVEWMQMMRQCLVKSTYMKEGRGRHRIRVCVRVFQNLSNCWMTGKCNFERTAVHYTMMQIRNDQCRWAFFCSHPVKGSDDSLGLRICPVAEWCIIACFSAPLI